MSQSVRYHTNFLHPGLEPGSRFWGSSSQGSGTPGQARGDVNRSDFNFAMAAKVKQ